MSGSNSTPQVLGATTTATGVAVLPNTGGSTLLTILSLTLISVGLIVVVSFSLTRILGRFLR